MLHFPIWITQHPTTVSKGADISKTLLLKTPFEFDCGVYEVDLEDHKSLERRKKLLREKIPQKAVVHGTLVTTYGLVRNGYHSDFVNVITMDDLFK